MQASFTLFVYRFKVYDTSLNTIHGETERVRKHSEQLCMRVFEMCVESTKRLTGLSDNLTQWVISLYHDNYYFELGKSNQSSQEI